METNHDSMVMVQSEFGCDPTIQSEPSYGIIYTNYWYLIKSNFL